MINTEERNSKLEQHFILSTIKDELIKNNVDWNHLNVIAGAMANEATLEYVNNIPEVRINNTSLKVYVSNWITKQNSKIYLVKHESLGSNEKRSYDELRPTELNNLYNYSPDLFNQMRANKTKKFNLPNKVLNR